MADATNRAHVRLAELVAALSLGVDLGFGQPMEHVLRRCLIAVRLAEALGLDEQQRSVVYYTALLVNVGCHSDAHEQAKWFGDDIASKAIKYDHDLRSVGMNMAGLRLLGSGHAPLHRFRVGLEFVLSGHRDVNHMVEHHAAIARTLAEQLQLPEEVLEALGSATSAVTGAAGRANWPAKRSRWPAGSRARRVRGGRPPHRGADAVRELARDRRGGQFDPALSDLLDAKAEVLLSGLGDVAAWDAVIDAEPALAVVLSGESFDNALAAIANFIDLKSPNLLGHGRAVADLAAEAGAQLGLEEPNVRLLRRAGLVHGFGRLGISNAILDKPGPLGAGEWERVRLQPYLTERMLHQSQALAPIAALAVQHRERLDGSGYPRGLSGAGISRPARVLSAADAYQAMREPRPHRLAHSPEAAAVKLRAEVKAGHLDSDAVEAVLGAAGHRVARRREGPAGLTPREVEVLMLVARGLSNKQVAERLVISPKTVANHVEHIYAKIDASNRAAASLFAMRHGLLPEEEFPARVAA